MDAERRAFEIRAADDGTLTGTVVPYNTPTRIGSFREQFAPASLRFDDVILNRQHQRGVALARTGGGGLTLVDSAEALRASITMLDTQDGRDVMTLIRGKVLRGLSAEFKMIREEWTGDLRTIRDAVLLGVGIVDSPQYAGATVWPRSARTPPIPTCRGMASNLASSGSKLMAVTPLQLAVAIRVATSTTASLAREHYPTARLHPERRCCANREVGAVRTRCVEGRSYSYWRPAIYGTPRQAGPDQGSPTLYETPGR